MQRILLRLPSTLSKRAYSTAPPPASTKGSSAPYFLGFGLVGAGAFYYSTLGSARKSDVVKMMEAKKDLVPALNSDEFRNFKLTKIIPLNHNTSTFIFDLPEGTNSGLTVASALVVKSATEGLALGKNGKPAIRPYTPTTNPNMEGKLELLVKQYPTGVMSSHIHSLKVGEELSIKGPIPKFDYKPNQFDEIALIAGGSGVTPMWQIMQEIDSNPSDKTKATLVFGNVTEEDILLRKEFEDLAARKPSQFKIVFVLDKPPTTWPSLQTGFINSKLLSSTIPPPSLGDKLKIFVCGPPGQVNAISGGKKSFKDQGELKGVLSEMGYKEEQVYKF